MSVVSWTVASLDSNDNYDVFVNHEFSLCGLLEGCLRPVVSAGQSSKDYTRIFKR